MDILSGHEGPVHGLAFSPTDANVSLLILCDCLAGVFTVLKCLCFIMLSLVTVDVYASITLKVVLFVFLKYFSHGNSPLFPWSHNCFICRAIFSEGL